MGCVRLLPKHPNIQDHAPYAFKESTLVDWDKPANGPKDHNWDKPEAKKREDKSPTPPKQHSWERKPHEERQNKRLDKKIGGTITPGSGKYSGAKGDRELDGLFKIEEKATDAQSISIRRKFLEKITIEATQENKEPALAFSFLVGKGVGSPDWVAVPAALFSDMYEAWKDTL